ncbi:ABC-type lipoprotein release transport system permease subunit [Lachnotalea glycerini]|uniref:ABC-type lipoprotein release transport system permease subunit n=1 Tax=Lachnotalea glycerini TaxID=1763509 RepID=A0A318EM10_9FIRM|nr:ABC-type lipoprotein release transport system permease subunit [Lachnotalea glycerini]
MRFLDLLQMSVMNLWRRKLRTVLTVLGVVIGTASIVVMLSLGFGLDKSAMEQIKESGGLTTISVTYDGESSSTSTSSSSDALNATDINANTSSDSLQLDDEAVEEIGKLEHVVVASPILNFSAVARQGIYEGYLNLVGMTVEALEQMNIPLISGTLPQKGDELKFVFGNQVIGDFYNRKTEEGYWETGELPDVDLVNTSLFVIFDTDAYYSAQNGEGASPKKYIVNGSALVEGDMEEYNDFSYNTYVDIEALKTQLKKVFKGKAIPGQPSTKSGKSYGKFEYSQAYVKVDEMNNVLTVQKQIKEMGFEATSNAEYLKTMQKQYRSIQAVLGGIGAVSLFVAAIGIANTMMMSIYERTKEIGIIKVLGCGLSNIRTMFLAEAAFIGFIGGFFGLILSYLISFIINKFLAGMYGYTDTQTLSYIPLWLPLVALVFAILVGMLAGFFPALRAMKLSPLAAIRNE